MVIGEDIFAVAQTCVDCSDEERETLKRLCTAAEASLRKKLRKEVSPEDCYENFVCAAAFLAAADLTAVCAGTTVSSFTAGPVSVSQADGRAAKNLRAQAELLMAPWCKEDFCFLGVEA